MPTPTSLSNLPPDLIMHVAFDARLRVLWSFAIAWAKTAGKDQPGLAAELRRQLHKMGRLAPAQADAGAEFWMQAIEAQTNELLDALEFQGDRRTPTA